MRIPSVDISVPAVYERPIAGSMSSPLTRVPGLGAPGQHVCTWCPRGCKSTVHPNGTTVLEDRLGHRWQGLGEPQPAPVDSTAETVGHVLGVLSIAGTALGAYHGYRRNDSVGWAILWGLLGGAVPFITIPVAFAQGFGKPAGSYKRNPCGTKRRRLRKAKRPA